MTLIRHLFQKQSDLEVLFCLDFFGSQTGDMVANILTIDPSPNPGAGSKVLNSTFSEHGHAAC